MSLKRKVMNLRKHGRVLGTRGFGTEVASELRELSEDADALVVDFAGVEVASSPFLDEIVCALRGVIADRDNLFVAVAHLNDDVSDTMRLVLKRRGMGLAALTDEGLRVLGGREHLDETLAEAEKLGTFTARELAERLRLKLPNLHQRLAQLEAAGVVTRASSRSAPRATITFRAATIEDLTGAGAR